MKSLLNVGSLARTLATLALLATATMALAVPPNNNHLPNGETSVPEPTGIVAAVVAGMFIAGGIYMNRRKK